ncbi:MAG: hypothetical protein Q8N03_17300 [Ignavibacteria bacterium]|nr:hypothetical protein [Ignavibacteria bacterium]MDP3830641.1 hypothetical protein [Ignavibacteriaceae bacterium]
MKHFYISCFIFFLSYTLADAQTNANVPGPENVLVVYNELDSTSIQVANYYKTARDIPGSNIVRLDSLFGEDITIDGITHHVKLAQENDIIQDTIQNYYQSGQPTRHAWKYYLAKIANPIKQHLIDRNLTNTISTLTVKFV